MKVEDPAIAPGFFMPKTSEAAAWRGKGGVIL